MADHDDVAEEKDNRLIWLARITVGIVFLANINTAFAFIFQPEKYISGFEVEGVAGRVIVQGIGILFLMWNVTYPFVILQPIRHMTIFAIVLIQQTVGVIGESWIYLTLPEGHAALRQTGLRFILFDGGGLLAMLLVYLLLWRTTRVEQALSRNRENL
jgi:hypothetical protein